MQYLNDYRTQQSTAAEAWWIQILNWTGVGGTEDSVTNKKLPNVYKSRPKMISLEN